MNLQFKQCTLNDLDELRGFARDIFYTTFAPFNTEENMAAYLEKAFNEETVRSELLNEKSAFYLAYANDELAGYIKINEAGAQTDINDPESLELERIYAAKKFQGKGVGQALMNKAVRVAQEHGKKYIWLGVWEKNEKAIHFYKRNGFYKINTHTFIVGGDAQTDYIMRLDLKKQEYLIEPCTGQAFTVKKGQTITVVDISGGQVADFFAECDANPQEFLSAAVTVDCNESLKLNVGDIIYTNLYRPMFKIVQDDVGRHDLLFPCCRKEMYDFFYGNGAGHPNCFDNINNALCESRPIIQPVNLFMNTKVGAEGKITIKPPLSKAGDKIVLEALIDVRIAVAACSVAEGECNNHECSAIKVIVSD